MTFYDWLIQLPKNMIRPNRVRRTRKTQSLSPASCEVLEDRRVLSSLAFGVDSSTDSLYVLDLETGDGATIGPLHPDADRFTTPVAMAVRPSDGTIFVNNNSPAADVGLATVDPATGLATRIGGSFSGALAFDDQGNLYSMENDRGFGGPLAIVDQFNGQTTSLGGPILPTIQGHDFNSADRLLYGITGFGDEIDLLVIDPSNGSLLATRPLVSSTTLGLSTPGTLYFDAEGTLFGTLGSTGKIFEIDPATGLVSNIQSSRFGPQGLGSTQGFDGNFKPDALDDKVFTDEDVSVTIHVLSNDVDIDGQIVNVTSVSDPAHGSVVQHADGTITYTPDPDFFGTDQFHYSIVDDAGGTDLGTVTVTVAPVNDAPSFALSGDQMAPEDAGPQIVPDFAIEIAAGPANETGQNLVFLVTTDNDALFAHPPIINSISGELSYAPALDANGTAMVTVVLMDDGGTENGGADKSVPQTFAISVLSPAEQISDITDQIQMQVDQGTLNQGQGNALAKKLEQVGRRLDAGRTNAALNNLNALANQVNALIESGQLTPQDGESIVQAIDDLQNSIETTGDDDLNSVFAEESLLADLP